MCVEGRSAGPQATKRPAIAGLDVSGRGERIRTSGPCLPKAVLYQAELHPEYGLTSASDGKVGQRRERVAER